MRTYVTDIVTGFNQLKSTLNYKNNRFVPTKDERRLWL